MAGLKGLNIAFIVVALNSVAAMGAAGFLFYTKVLYKRPAITEPDERARLARAHASPAPLSTPATLTFDPTTVNIEAVPARPKSAEGTPQQIEGKLHYATVAFALEIRDANQKQLVESIRPLIMDRLLSLLGRKNMRELTTVQGRYLLRTQLLDAVNELVAAREPGPATDGLATNIFFTQFIVQ